MESNWQMQLLTGIMRLFESESLYSGIRNVIISLCAAGAAYSFLWFGFRKVSSVLFGAATGRNIRL